MARRNNLAESIELALPFNYEPRDYQVPALQALDDGCKRVVLVWHRRAGKEKTLVNYCARAMHDRIGSYYYFFPTAVQGRKVLWDGMDREGFKFQKHFPDQLVKRRNSTEMLIEYHSGSIFQVIGTDKFDHIMGTNPIFVVFSEFSLQDPAAWEYIRPILLENGGVAVFDFTPRGRNHGWQILQVALKNSSTWYSQVLTVNDTKRPDGTPVITPEMIQSERDDGMSEEMIQQEYFCSFEGVHEGSYYGKQLGVARADGRIGKFPYDENVGVETWWDIGVGDSTAVWFTQSIGRVVYVIDFLEASGESLGWYAKQLKDKPYTYLSHNGPHDLQNREWAAGGDDRPLSRIKSAEKLGIAFRIVPDLSLDDGINAARSFLVRCYFDERKCEKGLNALHSYAKKWDEKKKMFQSYPDHNWASHAADAFRYLAVGHKITKVRRSERERARELAADEATQGWMGS